MLKQTQIFTKTVQMAIVFFTNELSKDRKKEGSLRFYKPKFSYIFCDMDVVINSIVFHAKESSNQVFHVLTDGENYYAMKLWFLRNHYKEASVQVLNVSFCGYDYPSMKHIRIEYLSIFSDSHYLLPDLFSNLEKVVVLDDDVVIQQDLSALWNMDFGDKLNGAVQFCSVKFRFVSNLGELFNGS
ncbi:probable galacturonosyltransferase 7 [Cajanus cajan]|uniref:probable galacturonosyltransferase 7 n=1 Tax=Cajanus cajan TaxID=3821 RepID=UPI00098DD63C|nr:probable galacturonosyltransferase 7 [Cajanus cajan]XP_020224642.1 probable galacturonosyltransferase 7 [Cajanus cajan]XP_020224643.1 probable galacturonosyltransferase 7 [Cajanus cajan]